MSSFSFSILLNCCGGETHLELRPQGTFSADAVSFWGRSRHFSVAPAACWVGRPWLWTSVHLPSRVSRGFPVGFVGVTVMAKVLLVTPTFTMREVALVLEDGSSGILAPQMACLFSSSAAASMVPSSFQVLEIPVLGFKILVLDPVPVLFRFG